MAATAYTGLSSIEGQECWYPVRVDVRPSTDLRLAAQILRALNSLMPSRAKLGPMTNAYNNDIPCKGSLALVERELRASLLSLRQHGARCQKHETQTFGLARMSVQVQATERLETLCSERRQASSLFPLAFASRILAAIRNESVNMFQSMDDQLLTVRAIPAPDEDVCMIRRL